MSTVRINSDNFSGQTVQVTYFPSTGGTLNLGTGTLPFDYTSNFFYGNYQVFFPTINKTCNVTYSAARINCNQSGYTFAII